jgi:hypothetical protein
LFVGDSDRHLGRRGDRSQLDRTRVDARPDHLVARVGESGEQQVELAPLKCPRRVRGRQSFLPSWLKAAAARAALRSNSDAIDPARRGPRVIAENLDRSSYG